MSVNAIISQLLVREAIQVEFIRAKLAVAVKVVKFKNKFSYKHLVNHIKINSKSTFSIKSTWTVVCVSTYAIYFWNTFLTLPAISHIWRKHGYCPFCERDISPSNKISDFSFQLKKIMLPFCNSYVCISTLKKAMSGSARLSNLKTIFN